jgi:hypothetical protein
MYQTFEGIKSKEKPMIVKRDRKAADAILSMPPFENKAIKTNVYNFASCHVRGIIFALTVFVNIFLGG